jgi:hypothetical protein
MSKTFLHSGSLGDIVYSLPTIQALGGGVLYIKDALLRDGYTQFDAIAPLIRNMISSNTTRISASITIWIKQDLKPGGRKYTS